MKIHRNKCYLKCSQCKVLFTKAKLMIHFQSHYSKMVNNEGSEDLIDDEEESEILLEENQKLKIV